MMHGHAYIRGTDSLSRNVDLTTNQRYVTSQKSDNDVLTRISTAEREREKQKCRKVW